MNVEVRVRVIFIIAIAAIVGSATANFAAANSVPPPIPHGAWGFVNDINGIPVIGADVTLTNTNTSESINNEITASDGSYTFGVGNLPSGCTDGDELLIHAKSSTHEGETTLVVNNSFTSQRADNITLSTPISTPSPTTTPIAVPEYNPVGLLILIGLLAVILALEVKRKR